MYDTNAIAINNLCNLKFNIFYHVLSYNQQGLSELCCVTKILSGFSASKKVGNNYSYGLIMQLLTHT